MIPRGVQKSFLAFARRSFKVRQTTFRKQFQLITQPQCFYSSSVPSMSSYKGDVSSSDLDYRRKPEAVAGDKKSEEEEEVFDKEQENLTGMKLVFRRSVNILEAVTERKGTTLLNIYCGGEMLGFFGDIINATYLSVTGITDDISLYHSCLSIPIFSEVKHSESLVTLPFGQRAFQLCTCLHPPTATRIPIEELCRVTNDEGVIFYGVTKSNWLKEDLLTKLSTCNSADLIAAQEIDCTSEFGDSYFLAILRKK